MTVMDETAPGELAVIERFVNTADLEAGTDEFRDPASLTAWLRAAGLARGAFGEPERERLVAFREALRELLLANHGGDPEPAATAPRRAASAPVSGNARPPSPTRAGARRSRTRPTPGAPRASARAARAPRRAPRRTTSTSPAGDRRPACRPPTTRRGSPTGRRARA